MTYPTGKSEKLFYVERKRAAYDAVATLPEEYLQHILPYAGVYVDRDEECDMISQHRMVKPFSIWIQDVFALQDIVICPYTPYPIWALHFMYETSLEVELYKNLNFSLSERECNLFSLKSHLHRVPMARGERLLSFHINIRPAALKKLALKYPQLKDLANKQPTNKSEPLNKYSYHINQVCHLLLERIFTCRHIEIPADRFLYRCCLDLFLNFAQQDRQLPMLVTDILHSDELKMIFELVKENPTLSLSVQQLSEIAALSPTVLQEGFLRMFSITIEDFVLMNKMMMVFDLLTQKDTPLSAIADAADYPDWQSLNNAFKAYYGCELEELRRAM